MDIVELIQTALGKIDRQRVEVVALEPVEVSIEAQNGLVGIISELVDNAAEFSSDTERFESPGWWSLMGICCLFRTVALGCPKSASRSHRVLEDPGVLGSHPETTLGIYLVAGLATRHGITVRLVPGVPGVTARVSIPSTLVEESAQAVKDEGDPPTPGGSISATSPLVDLFKATRMNVESAVMPLVPNAEDEVPQLGDPVTVEQSSQDQDSRAKRTEAERQETQAFLERVFAPLLYETPARQNDLKSTAPPNGRVAPASISADTAEAEAGNSHTSTTLQVREPGENIPDSGDDTPKIKAGEEAVDIKSALSSYDRGRQAAEQIEPPEDEVL